MRVKLFLLAVLPLMAVQSCKHEIQEDLKPVANGNNNPGENPTLVSFQTEVLPLLIGNCAMDNCHNAASAEDGVVLNSYENVMNTAKVVAGNPGASELYEVITETRADKRMPRPPAPPLTAAQIDLIRRWINEGAKNTNIAKCDTSVYTFSGGVQPIINMACKGCHGATNAQGGINLSRFDLVKQATQQGKLLCAVNHGSGCSPMPKGGNKLEACKITILQKWAAAGCPNN